MQVFQAMTLKVLSSALHTIGTASSQPRLDGIAMVRNHTAMRESRLTVPSQTLGFTAARVGFKKKKAQFSPAATVFAVFATEFISILTPGASVSTTWLWVSPKA